MPRNGKLPPKLNIYQCRGARCKCERCLKGNAEAAKRIKERIRSEGLMHARRSRHDG